MPEFISYRYMFIFPVYSPYDGGWYCDVSTTGGRDVIMDEMIFDTKQDAVKAAKMHIDSLLGEAEVRLVDDDTFSE